MRATIFLCTLVVSSIFGAPLAVATPGLGIVVALLMLLDLIDTQAKIETKKKEANADQTNTE